MAPEATIGSNAPRVGDPHRVVLRLVVAQLLAEPRHDQQRVVGRGPHREDEQDALRLAVDGQHVGGRQRVDRGRGHAERQHGGEHHDERQDRCPVDEQQDQQHDRDGDDQQHAVDGAEGVDEVTEDAALAADERRQPVGRVVEHRAHVLDGRDDLLAVGGRDLDDDLGGLAVLRRDRLADPARRRRCRRRRARRRAPRSPAGPPGVSPPRRSKTTVTGSVSSSWKLDQGVEDLGRLGALRQERRVVVLLHLGEPAGERAERPADEQPQQHHEQRPHPETSRGPPHGEKCCGRRGAGRTRARDPVSAAGGGCPGSSG